MYKFTSCTVMKYTTQSNYTTLKWNKQHKITVIGFFAPHFTKIYYTTALYCTLQNVSHQFAAHYIAENNIITKVLLLFTK